MFRAPQTYGQRLTKFYTLIIRAFPMIIFLDKDNCPLSRFSFDPDYVLSKEVYLSHSAFSIKAKDRGQLMRANINFTLGLQKFIDVKIRRNEKIRLFNDDVIAYIINLNMSSLTSS